MGFVGDALGKGNAGASGAAAANAAAELQIKELRRQFDLTQENLAPFIQAGEAQLGALTEGTTVSGLDDRISRILDSGAFSSLIGERQRGIQGQLAAGGLTRSGTAIQQAANIPTDLAFQLENQLTNRSANLVSGGQGTAGTLAGLQTQTSGQIGQTLGQIGQNTASGLLADQQSKAAFTGAALTAGAIFFSDPRLKDNVEQIASIHDLSVYQWDWKPETKGTIIENCGTIGFMADEVEEKYPHHVYEYGGYMVLDYSGLIDELGDK